MASASAAMQGRYAMRFLFSAEKTLFVELSAVDRAACPRQQDASRTLIRAAAQQLAYHRGCGDELVGLVLIQLLARLSADLIDEGTEAVAGRFQLTHVDIS